MNKSAEPAETNSCTIGADGASQCRDRADGGSDRQETANGESSNSDGRRDEGRNDGDPPSKPPSIIRTLHGQPDADAFVSANEAVVVEFMTNWCGACRSIEERYAELATAGAERGVRSARVVCDKNRQTKTLAARYNVRSYPVFVAFRDGVVSHRFEGADRGKLEAAFERLGGGSGGGGRKKKKRGGRSGRS